MKRRYKRPEQSDVLDALETPEHVQQRDKRRARIELKRAFKKQREQH